MERTGSMKYTRDTLKVLHSEVILEIEDLGGHFTLTQLVNRLDAELDDIKYTHNTNDNENENEKKNEERSKKEQNSKYI